MERKSNFELLRIIAILFIIFHHIAVHGGWADGGIFYPEHLSANVFFLQSLFPLGKIGVNLFVLISGYFLINSCSKTWPKVVRLWVEMLFYSILIPLLFAIFGNRDYSLSEVFRIMTPVLHNTWWFMSCYLVMLALSPFINRMLNACDERGHLKLVLAMLILWSVIPTVVGIHLLYTDLVWFFILYILGAYIARFPNRFSSSGRRYLSFGIAVYLADILLILAVDITGFGLESERFSSFVDHISAMNSVTCLSVSLFLFLLFCKINVRQSVSINLIASLTFGIYLIHDHYLVREYIYTDLFHCNEWIDSVLLIPYVLFVGGCIFTVCALIEYVWKKTMNRALSEPLSAGAECLVDKVNGWIDRLLEK